MAENITAQNLKVSTDNEYVAPCGRERCGKTGFGVLRIVREDGQSYASLEFLGAFCTRGCDLGDEAKDQRDVTDYAREIPPTDTAVKITTITALSRLGLEVNALPQQTPPET